MSKLLVLVMSVLLVACGSGSQLTGDSLVGKFANAEQASNYEVAKSSDGEFQVDGIFLEMQFDSVLFKKASSDEVNALFGEGASEYVEMIIPVDTSNPVAHGRINLSKIDNNSELLKQLQPYSDTWDGFFMFAVFGVIPIYTK